MIRRLIARFRRPRPTAVEPLQQPALRWPATIGPRQLILDITPTQLDLFA